jgi:hypothetical protein
MNNKRDKFIMLAEKRVNKVIKDINLIGNLSNKNNYQYTDDDVELIFKALENSIKDQKLKFKPLRNSTGLSFKLAND